MFWSINTPNSLVEINYNTAFKKYSDFIFVNKNGSRPLLLWVQARCRQNVGSNVTPGSKGKAVPLQARRGPEDSRQLSLPDFVTTAQDGGRLSALRTGRLYLQEILLVLISVRG